MRRGAKLRPWTSGEILWLLTHAGTDSKRDICQHLRRSSSSVEAMAHRLRLQGHDVSLRHYARQAVVCPSCGRSSVTARETGICRPCQLRRRLRALQGDIADVMARMPPEMRATYEATEAELGGRVAEPMPKRPKPTGTPYERARAEEAWDAAVEEWEARRLHRELRSAQRRKERMQRRLWRYLHKKK